MRPARIYALVLSGLLISLVIGCGEMVSRTINSMDPTVDLSGASTEKSKLVDICDCITIIKRETDDGKIHQIWSKNEGGASGFVLSPGKYHVLSRQSVYKVGGLNGSFINAFNDSWSRN